MFFKTSLYTVPVVSTFDHISFYPYIAASLYIGLSNRSRFSPNVLIHSAEITCCSRQSVCLCVLYKAIALATIQTPSHADVATRGRTVGCHDSSGLCVRGGESAGQTASGTPCIQGRIATQTFSSVPTCPGKVSQVPYYLQAFGMRVSRNCCPVILAEAFNWP